MASKKYKWGGDSLPQIENHSLCKHNIIRDYLFKYIIVRFKGNLSYPNSPFRLTIIDGFAGGGQYDYRGQTVDGSPLVILNTVEEAMAYLISEHGEDRVNLDIDIIFVEKDAATVKHLKSILPPPKSKKYNVHVREGEFGEHLPKIIEQINHKSGKKKNGKCLFILDQYGYSDVLMEQLKKIMTMNTEIILTFAIDSLATFFSIKNKPALINLGFPASDITSALSSKDNPKARRINIERLCSQNIKRHSNAKFYTPFFIHSDKSHWGYWLVHLSKHYKAKDVMMDVHWKHGNKLAHYGSPGLDMLSYKSTLDNEHTGKILLGDDYRFDDMARTRSMAVLPEEIARFIHEHEGPLQFFELKNQISNNTPASDAMIKDALWIVHENKEIIISRQKKENIKDKDNIKIPPQTVFTFK